MSSPQSPRGGSSPTSIALTPVSCSGSERKDSATRARRSSTDSLPPLHHARSLPSKMQNRQSFTGGSSANPLAISPRVPHKRQASDSKVAGHSTRPSAEVSRMNSSISGSHVPGKFKGSHRPRASTLGTNRTSGMERAVSAAVIRMGSSHRYRLNADEHGLGPLQDVPDLEDAMPKNDLMQASAFQVYETEFKEPPDPFSSQMIIDYHNTAVFAFCEDIADRFDDDMSLDEDHFVYLMRTQLGHKWHSEALLYAKHFFLNAKAALDRALQSMAWADEKKKESRGSAAGPAPHGDEKTRKAHFETIVRIIENMCSLDRVLVSSEYGGRFAGRATRSIWTELQHEVRCRFSGMKDLGIPGLIDSWTVHVRYMYEKHQKMTEGRGPSTCQRYVQRHGWWKIGFNIHLIIVLVILTTGLLSSGSEQRRAQSPDIDCDNRGLALMILGAGLLAGIIGVVIFILYDIFIYQKPLSFTIVRRHRPSVDELPEGLQFLNYDRAEFIRAERSIYRKINRKSFLWRPRMRKMFVVHVLSSGKPKSMVSLSIRIRGSKTPDEIFARNFRLRSGYHATWVAASYKEFKVEGNASTIPTFYALVPDRPFHRQIHQEFAKHLYVIVGDDVSARLTRKLRRADTVHKLNMYSKTRGAEDRSFGLSAELMAHMNRIYRDIIFSELEYHGLRPKVMSPAVVHSEMFISTWLDSEEIRRIDEFLTEFRRDNSPTADVASMMSDKSISYYCCDGWYETAYLAITDENRQATGETEQRRVKISDWHCCCCFNFQAFLLAIGRLTCLGESTIRNFMSNTKWYDWILQILELLFALAYGAVLVATSLLVSQQLGLNEDGSVQCNHAWTRRCATIITLTWATHLYTFSATCCVDGAEGLYEKGEKRTKYPRNHLGFKLCCPLGLSFHLFRGREYGDNPTAVETLDHDDDEAESDEEFVDDSKSQPFELKAAKIVAAKRLVRFAWSYTSNVRNRGRKKRSGLVRKVTSASVSNSGSVG